jgi:hypothetical protein
MVMGRLELGGRDHRDLSVQAKMIEPVDVFESLVFDVIESAPPALANQLGLV